MLNQMSLEKAVDAKLRVMKHLPEKGDLSLIILKGHLLIEELLFALVSSAAKDPEAIKSAKLSYYQLASVAKALYYENRLEKRLEKRQSAIWGAIFELNNLRNTLAHNLEPQDLNKKLKRFGVVGSGGHTESGDKVVSDPEGQMVGSIEFMCGALIGLILSKSSEDTS